MYSYLVIILCSLAAVLTTWKEYRAGKQRLGLRVAASLIAVAALAALAFPLSYSGQNKLAINEAVLLTPGFSKDNLGKFRNDTLLAFDPAVKSKYNKARLITPGQLKRMTPDITKLNVFGYGLSEDELNDLDGIPVIFHPAAIPSGFTAINWNDRIKQGQHLKVQGTFFNSADKIIKLVLKGLNTGVDSAVIYPKTSSKFGLSDLPKVTGPSVYRLIALTGTDTMANEELPLIVEPVKPLKILILASAPNFEDKFLKNWLKSNGFAVVLRSAISKNKFSSEYVNTDKLSLNNLSAPLLGKFDVVISDLTVLRSLSNTENNALKQQVTTKGLGLIVRADSIYKTSPWVQARFQLIKPLVKDLKPAQLFIGENKTSAKITTADQLFMNDQQDAQPLVTDDHNRWMAGTSLTGSGKISVIAINDSYTWMLNGDKDDYAALWSLLISKTVHTITPADLWQIGDAIPAVNEPVHLQLEIGTQPVEISVDSAFLSPMQNPGLPFQWQGIWWPSTPGWHMAKSSDSSAGWFYVYSETAWKSIKALQKINVTKQYAENIKSKTFTTQTHQKIKIPVPKVYFYILLLGACTFLWIEEKYRSGGV